MNFICERLGFPDFDRFADFDNARCSLFNSRYYCPGSDGVDAFTKDWSLHFNWLVPPLHLIIRTVKYLELCKAKGILVIPLWRSAHFWPFIKFYLSNRSQYVKATLNLGNIYSQGRNKQTIFGSKSWHSETMAILFDFR